MREANPFQLDGNWWNARLGKLTASRMAAAMNFLKSGKESTERENLRYEIVAERITNTLTEEQTLFFEDEIAENYSENPAL